MKYMVDIDNTICVTQGNDYQNSKPMLDRIAKINELYDAGHEVHYWTARGGTTGFDLSLLMLKQLQDWGAKYTTANIGKPVYDVWIDDKAFNSEEYFK